MSTLAVNTITNAAGGNTAQINGMTPTAQSLQGFRNRIINGDMRIDQRNAGAAVTHTGGSNIYGMDRMVFNSNGTPKFSVQRVLDAPAGFTYSAKLTTTTAGTPAAGDFSYFGQYIEGFNIADLNFGTAAAVSVTVSFWVKSSLTGLFGGAIRNGSNNRSYPFSFTINAANTWEQKAVTIAGDTTGTWAINNTIGMSLFFDTGSGSNNKGTSGAWNSTSNIGVTGGTNLVATSGATLNITGVQLEAGSVATPFERRPYGIELALCQRYFQKSFPQGTAPVNNSGFTYVQTTLKYGSANAEPQVQIVFPVVMRAAPTATLYNPFTGTTGQWSDSINVAGATRAINLSDFGMQIDNTDNTLNWNTSAGINYAVTAEL